MLDGFSSQEECTKLRRRMDQLLADFDPQTISIFTTTNQVGHRPFVRPYHHVGRCWLQQCYGLIIQLHADLRATIVPCIGTCVSYGSTLGPSRLVVGMHPAQATC